MDYQKIYDEIEKRYKDTNLRKVQHIFNKFTLLYECFGDNISEELIDSFLRNHKKDYILENLQTHDHVELTSKLRRTFSNICFLGKSSLHSGKNINFTLRILGTKSMTTEQAMEFLKNSEEFKNLVAFFGYEPTFNYSSISFEPVYTESANDYVYGNCYGRVYHITTRENANRVLKSGLRVRTGDLNLTIRANPPKTNYRNFPKRIYVCAFDPTQTKNIKERLKSIADTVGEDEDMVAICIRIPDKRYIPFYKDTAMWDENSFYTYTNIPTNFIDSIISL